MSKKRKMGFRGNMGKESEKRKRGNSYGYLLIPKGINLFSPEGEGKVEMDIMPYLVTDTNHPNKDLGAEEGVYYYRRPFKVHRGIGVGKDSVICLQSIGKRCPICEYRSKMWKDEDLDKDKEDMIKQLRPSDRNLYAVIIRKVGRKETDDDEIKLMEFSDYLFQEVMERDLEDDERWETFPDPEEGSSIRVTFAEDKLGSNKYLKATRFDFVDRDEQYTEDILDDVPKLDECLNIMSYEDLKAKFFEVEAPEEEEDDEPEEKPKRGFRGKEKAEKPVRTRRSKKEEKTVTLDDIDEMDMDELADLCEEKKLKIDPEEYEKDERDELAQDIAEELGLVVDEEPEEEEEEDEPEPEEKPKKKKGSKKDECPFGHTFGKDNDRHDDCDDCDVWNECNEEKRKLRKR